jgi:hypothetical protein
MMMMQCTQRHLSLAAALDLAFKSKIGEKTVWELISSPTEVYEFVELYEVMFTFYTT